jgi:hypothetical protein
VADEFARDFKCGKDEVKLIGETGTAVGRAGADPEKHALGLQPDGWEPVFRKDDAQTKR